MSPLGGTALSAGGVTDGPPAAGAYKARAASAPAPPRRAPSEAESLLPAAIAQLLTCGKDFAKGTSPPQLSS